MKPPAKAAKAPARKTVAPAPPPLPAPAGRVLKKYPNRRLYDTEVSSYITLAEVKKMVLDATPFEVRDAKTGEDLTRSILLQIILEEESGGVPIFSTATLAQIIRLYGHSMQNVMGTMLERNMDAFMQMQNQFVSGQAPVLHTMMSSYLEQSRSMFEKMQQQMFTGLPGAKR